MYTFDMYRLNTASKGWLLEHIAKKIKPLDELPEVEGVRPDLASARACFFVAEDSERITALLPVLRAFSQAGKAVVLAVPELLRWPAMEAWDFLPDAEKALIKIMLVPGPQK